MEPTNSPLTQPPAASPALPGASAPGTPVFDAGGQVQTPVAPAAPIAPAARPNWFAGITVVDVGVIALVSLALFYSIYHTRQQIFYLKTNKDQDRKDIDELKSQVSLIMGPQ